MQEKLPDITHVQLRDILMSNVSFGTNNCWNFIGSTDNQGYGFISIDGYQWRAHRLSYAIHRGEFNKSLHVCHHCDNPPCVNPEHLFLGSARDNMSDAQQKGRLSSGRSIYRR